MNNKISIYREELCFSHDIENLQSKIDLLINASRLMGYKVETDKYDNSEVKESFNTQMLNNHFVLQIEGDGNRVVLSFFCRYDDDLIYDIYIEYSCGEDTVFDEYYMNENMKNIDEAIDKVLECM